MMMILKDMKKEGRIKFYILTLIVINAAIAVHQIPILKIKILFILILIGVYMLAVTTISRKFAKNTHKLKGGRKK